MATKERPETGGEETTFLSRWARRKQDLRKGEAPAEAESDPEATSKAPPPDTTEAATETVAIEDLPDIDSLDDSSDFSVFLREGVPDALRRRALRKLWRVNPLLANLDGLNDYDEDFTDAAKVVEGLKTLYQVGKGVVLPEEDAVAGKQPEHDVGEAPDEPVAASASKGKTAATPEAVTEYPEEPEKLSPPAEPESAEAEPVVQSPLPDKPRRPAAERRWRRFDT